MNMETMLRYSRNRYSAVRMLLISILTVNHPYILL